MGSWWNRHPDALKAEIAGLNALGYVWSKNENEWQAGRLVVNVEIPHDQGSYKLTAEYPATFPYFPPYATLDGLVFQRHQHLLGKNLCLLAREGQDWRPGQDTLAILLKEQFPQIQAVNAASTTEGFIADHEDHVGEPFSSFLPYSQNCAIIVPDKTPAKGNSSGRLTLDVRVPPVGLTNVPFVNGIIRTISDIARKPLIESAVTLRAFSQSMNGFWLRLPDRPNVPSQGKPESYFFHLMLSSVPDFSKAIRAAKRGQVIVAGFVYADEASWRSTTDDWFFLAVRIQTPAKGAREAHASLQFIRADWGGEKAWLQRAPALLPLRTKSVLVIGLGSLGSPPEIFKLVVA